MSGRIMVSGCQSNKMHCSCTGLLECLGALVGCRSGGIYIVQKQDARAREPRQKRGRSCKRIREVRVSLLCGQGALRRGRFCTPQCAGKQARKGSLLRRRSALCSLCLSLCASVSKAPASAHAAFRRTCSRLRPSCSVKSAVLTSRSRCSKCLPIFAV